MKKTHLWPRLFFATTLGASSICARAQALSQNLARDVFEHPVRPCEFDCSATSHDDFAIFVSDCCLGVGLLFLLKAAVVATERKKDARATMVWEPLAYAATGLVLVTLSFFKPLS